MRAATGCHGDGARKMLSRGFIPISRKADLGFSCFPHWAAYLLPLSARTMSPKFERAATMVVRAPPSANRD
jgi:hypothetical protein